MKGAKNARTGSFLLFLAVVAATGCSQRPYAGLVKTSPESEQGEDMTVADDGTVTYNRGRLEVRLRPLSDEELNRQFAAYSTGGVRAANPYTFADRTNFYTGAEESRFTVFKLSVKNYEFPKVRVGGSVLLESDSGRKYYALDPQQLDIYYRSYALGYRGNEYNLWRERRSILQQTMFPPDDIFSGQEVEGFILFKPLAEDVGDMTLSIEDIVIRFDFRGDPLESIDVGYRFSRDLGHIYPDGRIELNRGT